MDKTRARFFENLAHVYYLSDAVIILRLASFVVTQARPIFDGGRLSIADSSHVSEPAYTYLRLRNTLVYGMTSLLLTNDSEVDETLFPAFHRVRTSTLGRFTKYMAESSCRSLYPTCGVTFPDLWTRPFFYDCFFRGVRHERKSRTLWQKSIGNHWKSVGNHGNLARNQKSGPSRNQEISEKSQEILEK